MSPEQVDVLKLVYAEKSAELRAETESANRLMTAFASLQLALAAWLFSHPVTNLNLGMAIILASCFVAACVWLFVGRNYGRRFEIVQTLQNAVDALQLSTPGVYLADRAVQRERYGHSWLTVHRIVIVIMTLVQVIPVTAGISGAPSAA